MIKWAHLKSLSAKHTDFLFLWLSELLIHCLLLGCKANRKKTKKKLCDRKSSEMHSLPSFKKNCYKMTCAKNKFCSETVS